MPIQRGAVPGGYCGPGRPRLYTAEERGRAVGLASSGVPRNEVARMLGIPQSTVKEWCRRYSVPARDELPDMLHEFPAWVRANRAMRGWTQKELGRRAGLSQGAVSSIEGGVNDARLGTAVAIIDAFGEEDS